jgi:hypothetical protein
MPLSINFKQMEEKYSGIEGYTEMVEAIADIQAHLVRSHAQRIAGDSSGAKSAYRDARQAFGAVEEKWIASEIHDSLGPLVTKTDKLFRSYETEMSKLPLRDPKAYQFRSGEAGRRLT